MFPVSAAAVELVHTVDPHRTARAALAASAAPIDPIAYRGLGLGVLHLTPSHRGRRGHRTRSGRSQEQLRVVGEWVRPVMEAPTELVVTHHTTTRDPYNN